jgi:hypothetical protein
MSNHTQRLLNHTGILAAVAFVESDGQLRDSAGDDKLVNLAVGCVGLFSRTDETRIRVIVGDHTINAVRDGARVVVVACLTGHPVMKSLKRMLRNTLRAMRPPVSNAVTAALAVAVVDSDREQGQP